MSDIAYRIGMCYLKALLKSKEITNEEYENAIYNFSKSYNKQDEISLNN